MTAAPLRGIRVLDLSMGWAGPLATRHLADLGAEIVKVESCQHTDWWRGFEPTRQWVENDQAEKAVSFNTMNRNKLDVTLDLTRDAGKELLKRLAAISDAVIENYSGAVLRKLGLDYPVLRAVKDDLIMLSMPAFGSTGGWRDYRAYGSTVEQASGLPHLHGREEDPPVMLHVAYGDAVAGLNAASALLVALRHRARTGEGQFLDLSQSECLFPLAAHGLIEQALTGQAPERRGNRSSRAVPHGVYPCAGDDAWIVLQAFTEDQWLRLQRLVGPALDGFGDAADRRAREDSLDAAVSAWTRHFEPDALMQILQAVDVPAGTVRSSLDLVGAPELEARGFWQWVDRAYVGRQPQPSAPYRAGHQPIPVAAPAPTLGQHNAEVLCGLLGLSEAELAALEAQQIVGCRPVLPGAAATIPRRDRQ